MGRTNPFVNSPPIASDALAVTDPASMRRTRQLHMFSPAQAHRSEQAAAHDATAARCSSNEALRPGSPMPQTHADQHAASSAANQPGLPAVQAQQSCPPAMTSLRGLHAAAGRLAARTRPMAQHAMGALRRLGSTSMASGVSCGSRRSSPPGVQMAGQQAQASASAICSSIGSNAGNECNAQRTRTWAQSNMDVARDASALPWPHLQVNAPHAPELQSRSLTPAPIAPAATLPQSRGSDAAVQTCEAELAPPAPPLAVVLDSGAMHAQLNAVEAQLMGAQSLLQNMALQIAAAQQTQAHASGAANAPNAPTETTASTGTQCTAAVLADVSRRLHQVSMPGPYPAVSGMLHPTNGHSRRSNTATQFDVDSRLLDSSSLALPYPQLQSERDSDAKSQSCKRTASSAHSTSYTSALMEESLRSTLQSISLAHGSTLSSASGCALSTASGASGTQRRASLRRMLDSNERNSEEAPRVTASAPADYPGMHLDGQAADHRVAASGQSSQRQSSATQDTSNEHGVLDVTGFGQPTNQSDGPYAASRWRRLAMRRAAMQPVATGLSPEPELSPPFYDFLRRSTRLLLPQHLQTPPLLGPPPEHLNGPRATPGTLPLQAAAGAAYPAQRWAPRAILALSAYDKGSAARSIDDLCEGRTFHGHMVGTLPEVLGTPVATGTATRMSESLQASARPRESDLLAALCDLPGVDTSAPVVHCVVDALYGRATCCRMAAVWFPRVHAAAQACTAVDDFAGKLLVGSLLPGEDVGNERCGRGDEVTAPPASAGEHAP